MRSTLQILLPNIFPMAMSVVPLKLAIILTDNSGVEVPKATTVNPTTRSETWNCLAMDEAPSTRRSAPLTNRTNPMMNRMYGKTAVIIKIRLYENRPESLDLNRYFPCGDMDMLL